MAVEPGLSEYITTIQRNRQKVVRDNIGNNNAAFAAGKQHGMFESYSGGRTIVEEMFFDDVSSFNWIDNGSVVSTGSNPVMTAAEYNHKMCCVAVYLSDWEKLINSGPEGVIKLAAKRTEAAEITALNKINASFFGDGTGSGGKEPGGLGLLVTSSPSTGTVGSIDRSTTGGAFFRNYALAVNSTFGANKNAANIKQAYQRALLNVERANDGTLIGLVGTTDMESIQIASQGIQRVQNEGLAKLGFKNIEFEGVPLVHCGGINFGGETLIGSTTTYFVNPKYLKLRYHKDCWMDPVEERQSVNQLASIKFLASMFNFTLAGAKQHAIVTD